MASLPTSPLATRTMADGVFSSARCTMPHVVPHTATDIRQTLRTPYTQVVRRHHIVHEHVVMGHGVMLVRSPRPLDAPSSENVRGCQSGRQAPSPPRHHSLLNMTARYGFFSARGWGLTPGGAGGVVCCVARRPPWIVVRVSSHLRQRHSSPCSCPCSNKTGSAFTKGGYDHAGRDTITWPLVVLQ